MQYPIECPCYLGCAVTEFYCGESLDSPRSLPLPKGSPFHLVLFGPCVQELSFHCWKPREGLQKSPGFREWNKGGWEVWATYQNNPPLYSLMKGLWKCRGMGAPCWVGTVLLYLKCFLTSFCAPVRSLASPFWLGPMLPLLPAPLPIWCSSWLQVLPATPLLHWPISVHFSWCFCFWSLSSFHFLDFF